MARKKAQARREGTVKITKAWLDRLQGTGKRESYYDATVEHLVLRVGPDGVSRVWYLSYRNQQGTRRLYRIGSVKQYDAEAAKVEARKLNGKIAAGDDPAAGRAEEKAAASRTLEAYLDGDYWLHTLKARKSGEATKARIKAAWKPFMDTDLAQLDTGALVKHRTKRLDTGKTPQTLNRDRTALLAMVNQAVRDKVIVHNPIADFPRLGEADDKRVRYLGQHDDAEDYRDHNGNKLSERERFMAALRKQPGYMQTIVELAMNSGCRRGEIFQLKWNAVNLDRRELTVKAATAKGNKTHVVPLTDRGVEILTNWRKQQTQDDKVLRLDQLVFPNPHTGKPFTSVKKAWAALVADARVEDFHLHDCRHDYASRLVSQGVPLYTVKELLGHSTIALTERYAHLSDAAKHAAVRGLK